MKQDVTLRFPTYYDLWGFIVNIRLTSFELNLGGLVLHCECDEQQLALAVSQYGAQLYNPLQNEGVTHEPGQESSITTK